MFFLMTPSLKIVKLRKDVKKARVLIIRKLLRNIAQLKKKKGSQDAIMKNLRRAERLLEDIHTMKPYSEDFNEIPMSFQAPVNTGLELSNAPHALPMFQPEPFIKDLKPDSVSRAALQTELNCEEVCKRPSSSTEERAVARIASHPLVSKKIAAIKAAVNSFKNREKNQSSLHEPQLKMGSLSQSRTEEISHGQINAVTEDKTMIEISQDTGATLDKFEHEALNEKCFSNEDISKVQAAGSASILQVTNKTKSKPKQPNQTSTARDKSEPQGSKCFINKEASKLQDAECASISQVTRKTMHTEMGTDKKVQVSIKVQNTNPIEDDAIIEEKEYFDDSTEERFHNKSSSDESGDDDFFIGKVKRTNKKKHEFDPTSDVNDEKEDEISMPSSLKGRRSNSNREHNSREQIKFGSLFCNNLSNSNPLQLKSSLQESIKNRKSAVFQKRSNTEKLSFHERSQRRPGKAIPKPQQSLHPSWEASRRRKEQNQILAFQGKKIRFDD
ncbi:serum response factor-binding protein 1 isoform X3 [Narcine bancroftii]|uniref:serum response factor-binding protein 1 isoform X3 n=1 Tax=Narcine bancroftii TaxID=1343680 RepID=UPI0038319937